LDTAGHSKWVTYCRAQGIGYFVFSGAAGNSFYVAGEFSGPTYVANDTLRLTGSAVTNSFIAKYDSNAHIIWLHRIYCDSIMTCSGKTDAEGYTYLIGSYSGRAAFGNDTITAVSTNDMFIARYDPDGNYMWSKTVPNGNCSSIATDTAGNLYISGYLGLGTINFDTITVTSGSADNFFVAKLSPPLRQWFRDT
jgi:hypothetical protein